MMQHLKVLISILLLVLVLAGGCQMEEEKKDIEYEQANELQVLINEEIFFSNPLNVHNIGDPFILKASDGKYYLYATSDGNNGFKVWTSDDMINWEENGLKAHSKSIDGWGYKDFWAPEVYEWDGKFHMYYSARWKENNSLRIGHAISDSPLGPFVDVSNQPMFDLGYAVIDGHVFIDDDNKAFFYFSRDCSENIVGIYHESHIYGVELASDRNTFIGEPLLLSSPSEDWEKKSGDYRWNEGPFVVKHNGKYYLNYSANFYGGKHYSVGYSTSAKPLGPFVKGDDSHLIYAEEAWKDISGSGHNMLIPIEDSSLYYNVYHTHTVAAIGGGSRSLNLGIVGIGQDGTMFSNSPNYANQLKPEYFEKALMFKDHYRVEKNGSLETRLTDHQIGLYSGANHINKNVEIGLDDTIEVIFDKSYKLDTILLYDGVGNATLEKVELEFSDGSLVRELGFDNEPGEPAIISFLDVEVKWVKIRNISKYKGSLSEIILVPKD